MKELFELLEKNTKEYIKDFKKIIQQLNTINKEDKDETFRSC